MQAFAKIFVERPPAARWRGDRLELTIGSGCAEVPVVLTRHAAVGLLAALQRELAEGQRVTPSELVERIARG